MNTREVIVLFKARPALLAEPLEAVASQLGTNIEETFGRFNVRLRPLFASAPEFAGTPAPLAGLEKLHGLLPEWRRYHIAHVPTGMADEFAAQMRNQPGVEAAYAKPPVECPLAPPDPRAGPTVPPGAPDFIPRQHYLEAAPAGVDARCAWQVAGGKGGGIQLIDIEGGWQFSHVDLRQNPGGVIGGTPYQDIAWRNHGTAVLGEIRGGENGFGICGISPETTVSAISHGNLGSAPAIQLAAQKLNAGDVLLLEMHRPGPRSGFQTQPDQRGYIAVEWWPDDFLAIQLAVQKGIIVVEAAGNGAENLDDVLYDIPDTGFPASWANPFRGGGRDSGAVIVGAGNPPSGNYGPDRARLGFSNYGARIDCQGWGREVVSTGYGDLFRHSTDVNNEDYWYTAAFSGTSSASPMVAGAVACLQGAARFKGGVLPPLQVRQLLRTSGSPQQGNTAERIGNRPDLRQLLAVI